ncbi:MAG: hypothetical protein COU11_02710 [Candidatus Harrisonbacteria bacterium CG10_big_fil_rev_8_21_14_0_10_49_15]|uniref:Uncharacterized protein n=1 Tax=Candidatus Harrisonbacteria bacterium CG10_big_fil_rev_8_21_14_0_10_49_15 TaxID=1974587 RepID=A0A2H0UL22_9BACT|nr:MAG: hypothetical protein COU11_02710 [Candidatus Harrisonbacteria bacterium CG10_big_fil_rev_8_21_14_0_10_49_15]
MVAIVFSVFSNDAAFAGRKGRDRLTGDELVRIAGERQAAREAARILRRSGEAVPRRATIAFHNADTAWKVMDVQIFRVNRNGWVAKRPVQSFSVELAPRGSFSWDSADFGRRYLVVAAYAESGEEILRRAHVPVPNTGGYTLALPGDEWVMSIQAMLNNLLVHRATSKESDQDLDREIENLRSQLLKG